MKSEQQPQRALPFNEKIITMMMESEKNLMNFESVSNFRSFVVIIRVFWHVDKRQQQEPNLQISLPTPPMGNDEQKNSTRWSMKRSRLGRRKEHNMGCHGWDCGRTTRSNMKPIIGKVWRSISS
jgi:hypothetical protein